MRTLTMERLTCASLAAAAFAIGIQSVHGQVTPTTGPRAIDGRPDLSGIWASAAPRNAPAKAPDGSVKVILPVAAGQEHAFLSGVAANERRRNDPNKPPYKSELLSKVKEFEEHENTLDPVFHCKPEGIPRLGPPQQIVQSSSMLVFLYQSENGNRYRVIPTDGRLHREGLEASYLGDSIGRWEGDTLVVDAVNFTDDTWLGIDGYFHSAKLRVIERLSREGNSLRYQATVEDPVVFTRPWVMTPRVLTLSKDLLVEEPPCIEKDSDHLVNLDHN
jgi:hypothetical protein